MPSISLYRTIGFLLDLSIYRGVKLDISNEVTSPTGLAFNSDGTKLYVLSGGVDASVYQYSMTIPYDLETASYDSVSYDFSSETSQQASSLFFSEDGTKMFIGSNANDRIYQYTLSTAFVVSSASYDSVVFDPTSENTVFECFCFSRDGTKLFVGAGSGTVTVYSYSLSTAWDLTSVSYDSKSEDVSAQITTIGNMAFNDDGTRLFIIDQNDSDVHEYSMTTAFDLDTIAYESIVFDATSQDSVMACILFNLDGTKMFLSGSDATQHVYEYLTGMLIP